MVAPWELAVRRRFKPVRVDHSGREIPESVVDVFRNTWSRIAGTGGRKLPAQVVASFRNDWSGVSGICTLAIPFARSTHPFPAQAQHVNRSPAGTYMENGSSVHEGI